MPREREWKTFTEWKSKYGNCVYVNVLGQPIIILGSLKAAHDLLSERSAIYSSRPRLVMAGELCGFNQSMFLMPYTPRLITLRRLIHKELNSDSLPKYWPLKEEESRILIDKVLLNPDGLQDYIRHYSGSVILRTTYGYQTARQDDQFLVVAEKVIALFSRATTPGAWLVDTIPWLRHLPSWLPGMEFKRTAATWSKKHTGCCNRSRFRWALDNQDSPDLIRPNYLSTIFEESPNELSEADADLLLWASGSLFGGGADTSVATLSTFFLAMALHPEIQAAAQAEID
ncbi:cytochrome P450 [Mycena polygramma]|nr:cytochrome P450 [Mycena polygramma]